jgi:hypothetical protein
MLFEMLDLLTQRRIGYLQGFCGTREAANLDDPNERPDCLHVIHDTPPVSSSDYAFRGIGFPCRSAYRYD